MNDFNNPIDENIYVDKILKWITDIIVVIMIALFFLSIFGEKTQVEGNSMSPALKSGESVLINKFSYKFSSPVRYDVIMFQVKEKEKNNFYIKRVIGLPGETLQIKNGRIYIDGEILDYNGEEESIVSPGTASKEIVLGEDEYFVIGDNWNNSEDSRSETIGNIDKRNIVGKVWFRVSPAKKLGFI